MPSKKITLSDGHTFSVTRDEAKIQPFRKSLGYDDVPGMEFQTKSMQQVHPRYDANTSALMKGCPSTEASANVRSEEQHDVEDQQQEHVTFGK